MAKADGNNVWLGPEAMALLKEVQLRLEKDRGVTCKRPTVISEALAFYNRSLLSIAQHATIKEVMP